MMGELVGIIIPVYNVEKYIRRCLDTVISQTYKNIEVLLIDDGSSDSSYSICQEYSKKDNRLKLLHKENGGVSSARNIGIDVANGKYISFVDADDWVEPDYIEMLIKTMGGGNNVIVFCQHFSNGNDDKYINCGVYEGNYVDFFREDIKIGYVWEGLYPKSLISDLRFDENFTIGEDTVFVYSVAKKAEKLYRLPIRLYHYFDRIDSAVYSTFNEGKMTRLYSWEQIIKIYADDKYCCNKAKATMVISWNLLRNYYFDEIFRKKYYKYTFKYYKKYLRYYLISRNSLLSKIKFLIISFIARIILKKYK